MDQIDKTISKVKDAKSMDDITNLIEQMENRIADMKSAIDANLVARLNRGETEVESSTANSARMVKKLQELLAYVKGLETDEAKMIAILSLHKVVNELIDSDKS